MSTPPLPPLEKGESLLLHAQASIKKNPGTLVFTTSRLAWAAKGQPVYSPSVDHSDFKAQHVSTAKATKVMLKLVMHSEAEGHTFTFTTENALKDRDAFKDAISAVLVKQKSVETSTPTAPASQSRPASSLTTTRSGGAPSQPRQNRSATIANGRVTVTAEEAKLRQSLLSRSKELADLHRDLVVSNIMSEEEFWETRKNILRNQSVQDGQKRGQPSSWIDMKPVTSEGQDVKFTLTPQLIHSIFLQHPSIKRAYDKNVPDTLSEREFWKRYFMSRFFHRNRNSRRNVGEPKDEIFDTCYDEEEKDVESEPKRSKYDHVSKLIDLEATAEDHDSGFGNEPNVTMRPGSVAHSLPLIRRFNRHADRVLRASGSDPSIPPARDAADEKERRRQLYESSVVIEDLQAVEKPATIVLDIKDTSRYFAPGSRTTRMEIENEEGNAHPKEILRRFRKSFSRLDVDLTGYIISPESAEYVMQTLNVTVNEKLANSSDANEKRLTAHQQAQVNACHAQGNEILRHFWASFPSSHPEKMAKAARMVDSIGIVRDRIKAVVIKANAEGGDVAQIEKILKPLNIAMDRCLGVYKQSGRP